jgi:hypothetical protein
MTNQHPITPPPELVQQWIKTSGYKIAPEWLNDVIQKGVQYGADQELEACIEWMQRYWGLDGQAIPRLRAARRPKPPSLKEQALQVLEDVNLDSVHYNTIRRALEQIND